MHVQHARRFGSALTRRGELDAAHPHAPTTLGRRRGTRLVSRRGIRLRRLARPKSDSMLVLMRGSGARAMPRPPAQVRSVEPGVRRGTTSTGVDGWFTIVDTRAEALRP